MEWSGVEWSGVEWSGLQNTTLTLTLTQTNKQLVEPACGVSVACGFDKSILLTAGIQLDVESESAAAGPVIIIVCGGAMINVKELTNLKKQTECQ